MTPQTLPDRLLADDELLNRLFAESNNFALREDVRALMAEAHNAIVEAAALSAPEGDMERALEWLRGFGWVVPDTVKSAIEEAIAAYDPKAGGRTALSGREAVAPPPGDGVVVPREPTPEMCAAGFVVSEAEHDPAGVYRAMIAAAPSAKGVEK